MKEEKKAKSPSSAQPHNVRIIPSSPLHGAGSIAMRQSSDLYRQTVIRYDENEIEGLIGRDDDKD
ncbi:MAG: hypothetical protein AAGN35_08580 [Bacteroidota bacterium]